MKFGVFSMNSDEGLDPLELAREVEGLGLESIYVPDHSHVPAVRQVAFAATDKNVKLSERDDLFEGGQAKSQWASDMPRDFYRNRDQLLTLAAMASVTSTVRLATGICLVVQRDPIWLAKQIATLDLLSNGRVIFGTGVGSPWNREEMAHHGVDYRTRLSLAAERIAAIREIWTNDAAEYHGKFVDFAPIHSWPKPVQVPGPPVHIGGDTGTVLERVAAYGDGWMPGHHDDNGLFKAKVEELQERTAAAGRGRMEISVCLAHLDQLDNYAAAGADRVIVMLPTGLERETLKTVAEAAKSF